MAESLFSIKELYIMEHTASGQSLKIAQIPKRYKRKQIYENMHLLEGMTFTAGLRYPQMTAITEIPDFTCVAYTERNKYEGKNQAVHFFQDDYRFRGAVWCDLERITYSLRKFDYYFTPDLSLWKDLPTDFYNLQNTYRTRFIGAYWQKCGYNVIPTASWGGLNSFAYCFEGLPSNSIIAVSGMGNMASEDAYNRWCYGLRRLEESKHPISILVYGQELDIPDLHTPVKFIPDFITTKLRKL